MYVHASISLSLSSSITLAVDCSYLLNPLENMFMALNFKTFGGMNMFMSSVKCSNIYAVWVLTLNIIKVRVYNTVV